MLPRYYALKLSKTSDDRYYWDFALERRPYKTYKKAYQACCKSAGIVLVEKPQRKRICRGREIWEDIPASLVAPANIPRKKKVVAPKLQDLPVQKRRGRPKGSKNKVK